MPEEREQVTKPEEPEFYVRPDTYSNGDDAAKWEFRQPVEVEIGEPERIETDCRVTGFVAVMPDECDPGNAESASIEVGFYSVEIRIAGGHMLSKSFVPVDPDYWEQEDIYDSLVESVTEMAREQWINGADLKALAESWKQEPAYTRRHIERR